MKKVTVKMVRGEASEEMKEVLKDLFNAIFVEGTINIDKMDYSPLDENNKEDLEMLADIGGVVMTFIKKCCTPAAYRLMIKTLKEEKRRLV